MSSPVTFEAALSKDVEVELLLAEATADALLLPASPVTTAVNLVHSQPAVQPMPTQSGPGPTSFPWGPEAMRNPNIKCYGCDQQGHIKRSCPHNLKLAKGNGQRRQNPGNQEPQGPWGPTQVWTHSRDSGHQLETPSQVDKALGDPTQGKEDGINHHRVSGTSLHRVSGTHPSKDSGIIPRCHRG